jgi:hypothetical protein
MREGSGSVASDASGNGFDLTINSGTWVAGQKGYGGVQFSGSSGSYGALPSISGNHAAICFFFRTGVAIGSGSAATTLLCNAGGAAPKIFTGSFSSSMTSEIFGLNKVSPATAGTYTRAPTVNANAWAHFAISWDSSTSSYKFIINGVSRTTYNASGHSPQLSGMTYNLATDGSAYHSYTFSDFRIYDTPLALAEVQAIYHGEG